MVPVIPRRIFVLILYDMIIYQRNAGAAAAVSYSAGCSIGARAL